MKNKVSHILLSAVFISLILGFARQGNCQIIKMSDKDRDFWSRLLFGANPNAPTQPLPPGNQTGSGLAPATNPNTTGWPFGPATNPNRTGLPFGPATNPNTTGLPLGPANSFTDAMSGITFEPVGFPQKGLKVIAVEKFSLGARNGLEPGHVIDRFNDRSVSNQFEMSVAVRLIPKSAKDIPCSVVYGNNFKPFSFLLTTNSGLYTTNFGKLELNEIPVSPRETAWKGTLNYGANAFAMEGSLVGNKFTGTLTSPRQTATVTLDLVPNTGNKVFQGQLNFYGRNELFMIIKN